MARVSTRINKTGRRSHIAVAALVLCLLGAPALPAHAQSFEQRVDRVEREIDTLNRSVFRGERPPVAETTVNSNAVLQAQYDERLGRIEQDLRALTGRIEEFGNSLNQTLPLLDRSVKDLTLRVTAMEQQKLATTPPVPTPTTPTAPASNTDSRTLGQLTQTPAGGAVVTPGDPTAAYEGAMTALKQKNYADAEGRLTGFLKQYPDHPLIANAKYWLGEAYFAQNKFDEAARTFAEGYQQYPKSAKAPGNLLKLGLSLAALDNKTDACVALRQIGKEFPTGASDVAPRAAEEIARLKCTP